MVKSQSSQKSSRTTKSAPLKSPKKIVKPSIKPSSKSKKPKSNATNTILHVGIEMGGTTCKVGIFNSGLKKRLQTKIFPTSDSNAYTTLNQMKSFISEQCCGGRPKSIGIACFGPLNLDSTSKQYGSITTTPKLAWQNVPIYSFFKQAFNLQAKDIFIDTDCNVCAMYEFLQLKNQKSKNNTVSVKESMCYVTVGTGVGIGLIINSKTVHGALHPEGGHVKVDRHPREYPGFNGVCPFHSDCVEGMVSNVAIKERLGLNSVDDVKNVKDSHLVWDLLGHYMGQFTANIFLTTSVERIIIGGGVFNRKCLLDKTRKAFLDKINGYIQCDQLKDMDTFIQRPDLGDELGMIAAAYVGAHH